MQESIRSRITSLEQEKSRIVLTSLFRIFSLKVSIRNVKILQKLFNKQGKSLLSLLIDFLMPNRSNYWGKLRQIKKDLDFIMRIEWSLSWMLFQEMLTVYLDLSKTLILKIFWKAFIELELKYWLILYKPKKIFLMNSKRMKTIKQVLQLILHS